LTTHSNPNCGAYLERVTPPIEIGGVPWRSDDTCGNARACCETIESLRADKIIGRLDGTDARKPSFSAQARWRPTPAVRFAGLPLGHEFTSLVLALLWTGGHPPKVEQDVIDADQRPWTATSTSRSTCP